jgi:WD40 repeat protein/serine/threonine protein kinase
MAFDFQRDYQGRLPLPLAQLYSRAYHDKDARARHNNAFYLFEATTKLAATAAAATYLHEVERGAPRQAALARLLAHLALPSLGQWVALLRELARHFGTRPDAAAHPLGHLWGQLTQPHADLHGLLSLVCRIKNGPEGEPANDRTLTLLGTLEALVQYRNAVFGHGAEREANFYQAEMGPLLFPALNDLLAEGVFDLLGPRGSRLVHVTEVRLQEGGEVEIGLRELINLRSERTAPLRLASDQALELAPNRVAVLWPGHPVPLRLDPLLVYRESETADEVLFLNRGRNKQVEYLSYTTGRTERDRAMGPALAELLSRITNAAVSEEQLHELAAQSLAETASVERLFGTTPAATRLGDYELLGEIGRGGMGVVVLARQLSLGRLVALKMLPADLAGDEVALARFRREIRVLSSCDHPYIVKVLTTGTMPDGELYYAMEYVPGCDLEMVWRELSGADRRGDTSRLGSSTWIHAVQSATRKRREETTKQSPTSADGSKAAAAATESPVALLPHLPAVPEIPDDPGGYTRRVATLFRDAAQALHAVHEQGLVHRDVKPANLMLTPDAKRVVLMDFGLAKGKSVATTLTRGGGLLGTLRYAAPEQLAAATLKVGPQADVRGLGATFWELLTRRRLFAEAEDETQLAQKVHEEDVPRLRSIDPGFDRDLEAILARATERRMADRIATAGLLAEYLQMYLDGTPLPIRTPGPAEVVWRWVREHKPLVATALSALAALAGTLLVSFLLIARSRDEAIHLAAEKSHLAEEKSQLADQNGKQAQDMRALADRNGQLFRDQVAALDRESQQRQRAEWQLYLSQMDKALLGLGEFRHDTTQNMLDSCRWDFRGWEHSYLSQQVNGARMVIDRAAPAVTALAFSGDGGRLVAGCGSDVLVFDARTGARRFKGSDQGLDIKVVACAASAAVAVTAGKDRVVRVWDLDRLGEPRAFLGHKEAVTCAAVSADGKHVATGDAGGTVLVWKADTLQEVCRPAGHGQAVVGVAFLPGGQQLLSVSKAGKIFWHELPSGKAVKQEEVRSGVEEAVVSRDGRRVAVRYGAADRSDVYLRETAGGEWQYLHTPWRPAQLAFSPDGRWLALGCRTRLYFFNTTTRVADLLLYTHLRGNVEVFAWSPDGARVACGTDNIDGLLTQVGFWDVAENLERSLARESFARSTPHLFPVDAAVSADGRTLVIAEAADARVTQFTPEVPRGAVHVWDLPRLGAAPRRSWRTQSRIHGVAVSPDGRRLATAHEDGLARLWDAAGKEEQTLRGHQSQVFAVAFRPDGRRLATASGDGAVRFWDVRDGALHHLLQASTRGVSAVAFSPDGRLIATGSLDGAVRTWETETGKPMGQMHGHGGAVNSLAFCADGRLLVSGGADSTVRAWDVASAAQLWAGRENLGHRFEVLGFGGDLRSVRKVLVTPDGRRVISLTGIRQLAGWNIRLWDSASGYQACALTDDFHPLTMALSPDGQDLIGCGSDGGLKVWRAGEGPSLTPKVLKEQALGVRGCAFSPDAKLLACASADKSLAWYDLVSGQSHGGVTLDGEGVCVAFHPAGGQLAHNYGARTVAVRPLRDGPPALVLQGHEDQVTALAYAPDGRFLATCGKDKTARLWDPQTGRAVAVLRGHTGQVSCLAFFSAGQQVVTGSWDETVRVWDVVSASESRQLQAPGEGVTALAVTPDGRYLVAGGLDGSLTRWDLAAADAPPKTWRGHAAGVNGLALLPDGWTVASAGSDGTARLWDVASGQNRAVLWVGGEGVLAVAVSSDLQLSCGCKDGATRLFDLRELHANRHVVSDD